MTTRWYFFEEASEFPKGFFDDTSDHLPHGFNFDGEREMSYPKKMIYLAGPIAGLSYSAAAHGWRQAFDDMLWESGNRHITCNSPMRGKKFLDGTGVLGSKEAEYPANPLSTAKGITTRDFNDVKNCDLMIACYLESGGRPSLGTAVEHGYAYAMQKPVIAVGDYDGDPNMHHVMLQHMQGYQVQTLREACDLAVHLLTGGL